MGEVKESKTKSGAVQDEAKTIELGMVQRAEIRYIQSKKRATRIKAAAKRVVEDAKKYSEELQAKAADVKALVKRGKVLEKAKEAAMHAYQDAKSEAKKELQKAKTHVDHLNTTFNLAKKDIEKAGGKSVWEAAKKKLEAANETVSEVADNGKTSDRISMLKQSYE